MDEEGGFFRLSILSLAYTICYKWNLLSVCDPVMGDEGKLYVPQELVSVYREKVALYSLHSKLYMSTLHSRAIAGYIE